MDKNSSPLIEIPVFLCYRRVDGDEAARKIFNLINDQKIALEENQSVPVKVYFDQQMDGFSNWTEHHEPALQRARSMLIIVTPGITADLSEAENPDWVHMEIRWWLKNRKDIKPILIDCTGEGTRFLPSFVKRKWESVQLLSLDLKNIASLPIVQKQEEENDLKKRILGGIRDREGLVRYEDIEHLERLVTRYRLTSFGTGIFGVLLFIAAIWLSFALSKSKTERDNARALRWVSDAESNFTVYPNLSLNLISEALKTAPTGSESERFSIAEALRLFSRKKGTPYSGVKEPIVSAVSMNENLLAIGGSFGELAIWDMQQNKKRTFFSDSSRDHEPYSISYLRFTPDGKFLIIADPLSRNSSGIWVARIDNSIQNISIREMNVKEVEKLDIDPKGKWLCVGHNDGNISFYDLKQDDPFSTPKFKLKGHAEKVTALTWDATGTILGTGSFDGNMRLWNLKEDPDLTKSVEYNHPEGAITALAFGPNDSYPDLSNRPLMPFTGDHVHADSLLLFTGTGYKMFINSGDSTSKGGAVARNQSKLRIWRIPADIISLNSKMPNPLSVTTTSLFEISKILPQIHLDQVSVIGYTTISPNYGVWYQKKGLEIYSWKKDELTQFNYDNNTKEGPENLRLEKITDHKYLYDAVLNEGGDQLYVSLVSGGIERITNDNEYTFGTNDGVVRSISTWKKGFISNGEDDYANIWKEDGSEANIGSPIPGDSRYWTASDFQFQPKTNELIIAHDYNNGIAWWSLDKKLHKIARNRQANQTWNFENVPYFFSGNLFSDNIKVIPYDLKDTAEYWIPGKLLDVHIGLNKAVVKTSKDLFYCTFTDVIKGSLKNCLKIADSTASQATILNAQNVLTINRESQGESMRQDEKIFSKVKWLRIKHDSLLTEINSIRRPFDVAYCDSKWLVLTYQDTRNEKGGEIWNLEDLAANEPFIKIDSAIDPVDFADIIDGHWLMLYHFEEAYYVKNPEILHFINLNTGKKDPQVTEYKIDGSITSKAFKKNDVYLGTGGGKIWVIQFAADKMKFTHFTAHDVEISAIAVSEDETILATGDKNGVIKIWDLKNPSTPPITLRDFSRKVDHLKISDDNKWIATSAVDEAPRIYCIDPKILSEAARQYASKPLSDEDRKRFGIE